MYNAIQSQIWGHRLMFEADFFLFKATLVAYGSPRVGIEAAYAICQNNAGSKPCLGSTPQLMAMPDHPTHWARPGIESATSLISTAPQWELVEGEFLSLKKYFRQCTREIFMIGLLCTF